MYKIIQRYYVYILAMSFFGFLFRAIVFYQEISLALNALLTVVSMAVIVFLWLFFDWLNNYLNTLIPYEQNLTKRIFIQVGIGLFFTYLFLNTIFSLNIYFYHFVKINKIIMVAGNLLWTLLVLAINSFFMGEYFFTKWKQALVRSIEAEKHLAQMQFANLQNQLNPHFLFNSLTTLNSLIYENQAQASAFLKQLATMYRYVMRHNQDVLVSISDELSFIHQYLALLNTRFGSSFRYEINIPIELASHKIVPVTLQILIENVVKHNQMSEENPLFVEIYTEGQFICVKNRKQLRRNLNTSNKIGLQNLKKLYLLTSANSEVLVTDTEGYFLVKVPLL